MRDWQNQSHVKYYCRYHIVFVPKYRRKSIYGTLRKEIGRIGVRPAMEQFVKDNESYI